jgi:hypothetical protein
VLIAVVLAAILLIIRSVMLPKVEYVTEEAAKAVP